MPLDVLSLSEQKRQSVALLRLELCPRLLAALWTHQRRPWRAWLHFLPWLSAAIPPALAVESQLECDRYQQRYRYPQKTTTVLRFLRKQERLPKQMGLMLTKAQCYWLIEPVLMSPQQLVVPMQSTPQRQRKPLLFLLFSLL